MKTFSRRRFVQFFAAGASQGQTVARWTLGAVAAGFLSACRSLRGVFCRRVRWVFPTVAGDFVLVTSDDAEKMQQFPIWFIAERLEFPTVAATILGETGAIEIDSDRSLIENVAVLLEVREPGTQLFREHDVIRPDLRRMRPSGDFTISFSPVSLFPAINQDAVPLSIDVAGAPRSKKLREHRYDRDKLLRFDFCVRPAKCQTGPVRSTLPTVRATWPDFNLLVHTSDGETVSFGGRSALTESTIDLSSCVFEGSKAGGKLRALKATFPRTRSLTLAVDRAKLTVDPSPLAVLFRPGFIEMVLPAGATIACPNRTGAMLHNVLAQSLVHVGNVYSYAWASVIPSTTTELPVEYFSRFCLKPDDARPWALTPERVTIKASGSAIDFQVTADKVDHARVSARMREKEIVRGIEQQFKAVTLTLQSDKAPFAPMLQLSVLPPPKVSTDPPNPPFLYVVDDKVGRFAASADVTSSSMILVADLFVRPKTTLKVPLTLELRFKRNEHGFAVEDVSTMSFQSPEIAWAGHSGRGLHPLRARDWVHLRQATGKEFLTTDYRGTGVLLASPAPIVWDIFHDRFRVTEPIAPIGNDTEVVSLAAETFRAALSAEFPAAKSTAKLQLPPFGLREHRDLMPAANWTDATVPAFKADTMWEPRTGAALETRTESPADLFESIAADDFSSQVDAFYAGFAISGTLTPLRKAEWAPDVCAKSGVAPYRAILGSSIEPIIDAVDIVELPLAKPAPPTPSVCLPPGSGFRNEIKFAFDRVGSPAKAESLQRVIRNPRTELALSALGGTIDYEWAFEQQDVGLQELVLRGFLGRYQKNYAIFADLLLPWGLRIFILALTSRQDSGRLRFCKKWWFAEPLKNYGDRSNIVLDNLRPLNSVDFNINDPFLFKGDFHYLNGSKQWTDANWTLQGVPMFAAAPVQSLLKQSVVLQKPQALTLFHDTPMQLHQTVWSANTNNPCLAEVTVASSGELEAVEGMHYDTRALDAVFKNTMDPRDGKWTAPLSPHDDPPIYHTNSLTLGDGVVRVDRPLRFKETWSLTGDDEHTFKKNITLRDVGLLQLVLASESQEFLDNTGTLTIHEKIHLDERGGNTGPQVSKTDAEVDSTVDFPSFTKGVTSACDGPLSFRMRVTPKSFRATFKKSLSGPTEYDATLVADIGVPGLLVLKDCKMQSRPGQAVSFSPGSLEPCGDLLKQIFEFLLEKLKGLLKLGDGGDSPFTFELLDHLIGFLVKFRIPMPKIPFGIGSLESLTFDTRMALAIDISRSGIRAGGLMTFILGDYPKPGLGKFDWLNGELVDFAMSIFRDMSPPTLNCTPFTVRFSVVISVKVTPPKGKPEGLSIPNPFQSVCFAAAVCISAEGGLSIGFDIGVASGRISLTLGIIWCPNAKYLFSVTPTGGAKDDGYFSFDEIALFVRIELTASVLGIVNVFVRVEVLVQLKLTCKDAIVSHMECSGTARIEMGFVKYNFDFTVDLDPILGIKKDPKCFANSGPASKGCALLPEPSINEFAAFAARDFFSFAEVLA